MGRKQTAPEAEHVFVRGEGGSIFKLDLPLHESIAERLAKGYIVRVANEDGDPYDPNAESSTPKVPDLPTERPALSALKPEWVGWAVRNGMTPDDAEAATKDDLIEKFGKDTPPAGPTGQDTGNQQ